MKKDNSSQDQKLLAEIEDIIRTRPLRATLRHQEAENLSWFGRATAAIRQWDSFKGMTAQAYSEGFFSTNVANVAGPNLPKFEMLLYQAQHDLRMRTIGPANIAIGQGEVFRYFDALRGFVEMAASDLLFVDRYMGPEFISTYMALVKPGVMVRLLTREKNQHSWQPLLNSQNYMELRLSFAKVKTSTTAGFSLTKPGVTCLGRRSKTAARRTRQR